MACHVAILLPPYVRLILAGRKTIESRLTQRPLPPFGQIQPGERIYFKASSGPYQATAIAHTVAFLDQLTPARLVDLQRRYNPAVCGDDAYWQRKRLSRYATFITLREVQPTAVGPAIPPSRGPAWFVLPDTASPLASVASPDPPLDIPLTAGALRNRYLRLSELAPGPLQLTLPDGSTLATELLARKIVRYRRWGEHFTRHALKAGDVVRLVPLGPRHYRVVFVRVAPSHAPTQP